jgi:hypothetical protein
MAKASKPKKKGKYDTTLKTDLTPDELLNKMLSASLKKNKKGRN